MLDGGYIEDATCEGLELADVNMAGAEFRNVSFVRCTLSRCIFERSSFYSCGFTGCDMAECAFSDAYLKQCRISGARGVGANFTHSNIRETEIAASDFSYGVFASSKWEACAVRDSRMKETSFAQSVLKKLALENVDFTRADFFKTPLAGLDMSACVIDGIYVSDTFAELRGLTVSAVQSPGLVSLLGVKII